MKRGSESLLPHILNHGARCSYDQLLALATLPTVK
jgi:hypothetical protein